MKIMSRPCGTPVSWVRGQRALSPCGDGRGPVAPQQRLSVRTAPAGPRAGLGEQPSQCPVPWSLPRGRDWDRSWEGEFPLLCRWTRTCLALTWGRAASSPAPLPRQSVCVRLPGSSPWRWVSPGFCGWKEAAASGLFSVVASHCHCSQDTVLSVARVQWSPRGRRLTPLPQRPPSPPVL